MISLIKNELTKVFHKKTLYIILIVAIGFMILNLVMTKYFESSYGVIHCLIHEKTKEKFALKKIIAYSLNKIQEFTKEFELVHICQHPNILKI